MPTSLEEQLTYPITLETFLTAEEAVFALLLTCRALQRASIVAAVAAFALPSHLFESITLFA